MKSTQQFPSFQTVVSRSFALILVVFLTLNCNTSKAQDFSAKKWSVLDMSFNAGSKVKNPIEQQFGAQLIHESGTTLDIPGFYNGNGEWIVRFSPPTIGKWRYLTYSSLPGLAGKRGEVSVGSANATQKGPIVIDNEDRSKFKYANGDPYFLLAFELDWLFALDAKNKGDIPKTRQLISQVKANGFNQIVMNVYAYDANWGERDKIKPEHNYAKPDVFPFLGSNEKPDYSDLNYAFFQHLDRVIAHLDQQGIVSHLMIYVWNKKVSWPDPESKADNMYFDYVVKRYQAYPNLIWDISKEALAYGRDDIGYITRRIDRLRKLDAHGRLVSVHDYNYCRTYPQKVDFISVQEWMPNLYGAMDDIRNRHADMPVFNIEHGGYEKSIHSIFDGAYTDPVTCLERNYQCVFAGTYSTYYWQNTSWYNVVTDPMGLPENQRPRFQYYKYLANLFEAYDFNALKPFQDGFAPQALTDGDGLYLYLLPGNRKGIYGELPAMQGKNVSVKWFDPLNGEFYEGETRKMEGRWLGFERDGRISGSMAIAIIEVMD